MQEVTFKFNIDDHVKVEKINFSGIVSMCAIGGIPENPEKTYYIQGPGDSGWYPERLVKGAE
jgi:hypothetical protein